MLPRWSSKRENLLYAYWMQEYQMCETFGIAPKGLFHDLKKTYFMVCFKNALNRLHNKKNGGQ